MYRSVFVDSYFEPKPQPALAAKKYWIAFGVQGPQSWRTFSIADRLDGPTGEMVCSRAESGVESASELTILSKFVVDAHTSIRELTESKASKMWRACFEGFGASCQSDVTAYKKREMNIHLYTCRERDTISMLLLAPDDSETA